MKDYRRSKTAQQLKCAEWLQGCQCPQKWWPEANGRNRYDLVSAIDIYCYKTLRTTFRRHFWDSDDSHDLRAQWWT